MDGVLVDEGIPFVGDSYNLTLVRVKLHETVPFPLLVFIKIFLEKGLIKLTQVCINLSYHRAGRLICSSVFKPC